MNLISPNNLSRRRRIAAFTLSEIIVAIGVLSVVVGALCSGIVSGFASVRLNNEDRRATEILTEKMEIVRLCGWTQLISGAISTNFTVPFYTPVTTNTLMYTGAIAVAAAPFSEFYTNDLRKVTVSVTWTSAKVPRTRSQTSLVSTNGLQRYIY